RPRVALFGIPVAHSVSPAMHYAAFGALGLDGCYVAQCIAQEDLPAAVDELRRPPYLGANVTVPHKAAVARLVDTLDEAAAAARAEALAATMRERYGGRVRAVDADGARDEAGEADLIVNATSAGLDGVSVPLDGIQTRPGSSLYDMVYTPSPTPLMRLLAAQG